jgi:hypothetical protein
MATSKVMKTTRAAKPVHGGLRPRAGRPADPDPSIMVNGRVKSRIYDWLLKEVEEGRARSMTALVSELLTEAVESRNETKEEK